MAARRVGLVQFRGRGVASGRSAAGGVAGRGWGGGGEGAVSAPPTHEEIEFPGVNLNRLKFLAWFGC